MLKVKIFISSIILCTLFLAANTFAQSFTFQGGFIYSGSYGPSVSVVDPNVLWVAGGYGVPIVTRSTNAGATWTTLPTNGIPSNIDLFCVWGVDANTCWAGDGGVSLGAGGNAKIWKTTNAGVNWTTVLTTGGSLGFINGIQFSRSNPQIGVAESDPPTSAGGAYWWALTTNGGTSFTIITGGNQGGTYASAQNAVALVDELWFGVGTSNNTTSSAQQRIVYTTNGGTSFLTGNLATYGQSTAQSFVNSFSMNTDKMHGIAGGVNNSGPNVNITTDGCATWTLHNMGGTLTGNFCVKWVPGTNTCYCLGATGSPGGRRSTDGGVTWTNVPTASLNFTHMDCVYNSGTHTATVFAVAGDGSCGRMIDTLVFPLGIQPIAGNTPTQYSLGQNYPNPFNPTTTIKYDLPVDSRVSLKVYNILGQEVATLVNQEQNAGTKSISWNAANAASGVYFYRLDAGHFTSVRKLLLLK